MKEREKWLIGVGLGVGVLVLIILAFTGFFRSNDGPEVPDTVSTSDSSEVITSKSEDRRQEISLEDILEEEGKQLSTEETKEPETVESHQDINDNDYIEWQQQALYEREIRKVNEAFFSAYYGNLSPNERNEALAPLLVDHLYEEEKLPESGQVVTPHFEEVEVETLVKQVDHIQGSLVNIVQMNVNNVPQRMLVTVSLVQSESWLIDQLTFELIHSNEPNM